MKKLIQIFTLLLFGMVYSQYSKTVFEEQSATAETAMVSGAGMTLQTTAEEDGPPADPPNPVPIDDYLFVLVLVAATLIFLKGKKMVRS